MWDFWTHVQVGSLTGTPRHSSNAGNASLIGSRWRRRRRTATDEMRMSDASANWAGPGASGKKRAKEVSGTLYQKLLSDVLQPLILKQPRSLMPTKKPGGTLLAKPIIQITL